jgi:hypothetical protein
MNSRKFFRAVVPKSMECVIVGSGLRIQRSFMTRHLCPSRIDRILWPFSDYAVPEFENISFYAHCLNLETHSGSPDEV